MKPIKHSIVRHRGGRVGAVVVRSRASATNEKMREYIVSLNRDRGFSMSVFAHTTRATKKGARKA
jgi:hypothetical protein